MPIRPEERSRYPADWLAISLRIRTVRARGRCECVGQCGKHDEPCAALNGEPHPVTGSNVVLTTAHLNHVPEDVRDENLAAMCQRCHLAYDSDHHAETRARTIETKRVAAGIEPLFPREGDLTR